MEPSDTIVAPASPGGRGALSLVRLSGSGARTILQAVFRPHGGAEIEPRLARVGELLDRSGQVVDECVALFWEGPASATGEDVVEFSVHGSPPIVHELVEHACSLGARVAEPGEFTLRALRNGRIDLARAEAVADIVGASTVEQARVAARQVRGEVGKAIGPLAETLVELLADVEASLDFSEDEGLGLERGELARRLEEVRARIDELASRSEPALRVREGARVVLVGPPNAGKSSLFNALVGRERVIVSEEPGTTRDTIEETIVIEGLPIVLVDGAGQGMARGQAESEGMRRIQAEAEGADLLLRVYDLRDGGMEQPSFKAIPEILVGTRADLYQGYTPPTPPGCVVGTPTSLGVDELRQNIAFVLGAPGARPLESVVLATRRHRDAAARARDSLERACGAARRGEGLEIVSVDLREALGSLHEIVGEITPEDLLGVIFARFCVGK